MIARRRGQALALVLLVLLALVALVAAGAVSLATETKRGRDVERRSALAVSAANRMRESAAATPPATPTPLRTDEGERSCQVLDLNGDALQVAQALHMLVRDLGLGADGVGFEAAGTPPPTAEDPTFDAGWVLTYRRSLAGDRFPSVDALAGATKSGAPIWSGVKALAELAALRPYLDAAAASRATLAAERDLIDINGDPLETARQLHALLGVVVGADGTPIGANGIGIEADAAPPTLADLAGSPGSDLADVVAIVRARLARPGRRFERVEQLLDILEQRKNAAGVVRDGALLWSPAERWEYERLAAFLIACTDPSGPRAIQLETAPREVLVAGFAVHLADLIAAAGTTAATLADDWIDRRRTAAITSTTDLTALLAARGMTADGGHLARFAVGPAAAYRARLALRRLASVPTVQANTYREGASASPRERVADRTDTFDARLRPTRLPTAPLVPTGAATNLLADPFALALRGGRKLFDGASPSLGSDSYATATGAVALPSGTRRVVLRVWLAGDSAPGDDVDGGVQDVERHAGEMWRALATGAVERRIDLGGTLGTRWVPRVAGLDLGQPAVALARASGTDLYVLHADGSLRSFVLADDRWEGISGPTLASTDRVSALTVVAFGGTDRAYVGTREGRVFWATKAGSWSWTELPELDASAPPRVLALVVRDAATHALAAGVYARGVWELGGGPPIAWTRADSLGVASCGSLAKLSSGEVLAGTSAGLQRSPSAGTWAADPDAAVAVPIADVWTDGSTARVATIGSGVFSDTLGSWAEVGGAAAAGKNVRAVAFDTASVLVWGAAADGSIAVEAVFKDVALASVGTLSPRLLPASGQGRREAVVEVTLSAAAVSVELRVARYLRTGASAVPTVLEVALADASRFSPTTPRVVAGSDAQTARASSSAANSVQER